MIDRLFSAALTFILLAGGTLAVGTELFRTGPARVASHASAKAVRTVQLERVVVTAKRGSADTKVAAADAMTLATLTMQ